CDLLGLAVRLIHVFIGLAMANGVRVKLADQFSKAHRKPTGGGCGYHASWKWGRKVLGNRGRCWGQLLPGAAQSERDQEDGAAEAPCHPAACQQRVEQGWPDTGESEQFNHPNRSDTSCSRWNPTVRLGAKLTSSRVAKHLRHSLEQLPADQA